MPNLRPVRRGQLISPFGIGAMVDFRNDESLMPDGPVGRVPNPVKVSSQATQDLAAGFSASTVRLVKDSLFNAIRFPEGFVIPD